MEKVSASSLLDRFWNGVLPVDPTAIAQALGLRVVPLSDADVEKGLSGALHWYQVSGDSQPQLYCRYNATTEGVDRQRFTIAHEIGHYASGHMADGRTMFRDTSETFTGRVYQPEEIEANRFAADLLMPASLVESSIKRDGFKTVQALAQRFGVSTSAMRWRLVNLGLLSSV